MAMKKYKKFTPIEKIVPPNYLQEPQPEPQNYPVHEPVHMDPRYELQNSNIKKEPMVDDILEDLPDEETSTTFVDKVKKYIKLILTIAILFILINNPTAVGFIHKFFGNYGFTKICDGGSIMTTSLGIIFQGISLGIILVFIKILFFDLYI